MCKSNIQTNDICCTCFVSSNIQGKGEKENQTRLKKDVELLQVYCLLVVARLRQILHSINVSSRLLVVEKEPVTAGLVKKTTARDNRKKQTVERGNLSKGS
jgi:hypothetical protein